ncbi:MAG: TonB-dependent receptor plug domain-containing protein, partial [Pseudomonadota bacterium]
MIYRHMLISAIVLLAPVSAYAQTGAVAPITATQAQGQIETYSPGFFDQFQPVTALDMLVRVPGFSLRTGDSERGFGEADTNFLINGRRPSTKNQSAREILSRIPANTVIRIEILDGDTLDIPGLSGQVADIVIRSTDLSGQWRYAARFEEGAEPQLLEGEVSLSGERGDLSFVLALEANQFNLTEDSVEQFFDGFGALIEDRTEDVFLRNSGPEASLNLTWAPQAGAFQDHIANLNLSVASGNDNSGIRETFIAIDPSR